MKQRKASSVNATPEVAEFITKLPKGGELWKLCKKALIALSDNIFAGTQIEKSRIPKFYIEKYQVTNINVFRLDASRRLVYTWIPDANGVSVNVIEIFLDHKQYEKRFGYS
jgi:hypothetical protein